MLNKSSHQILTQRSNNSRHTHIKFEAILSSSFGGTENVKLHKCYSKGQEHHQTTHIYGKHGHYIKKGNLCWNGNS